MRFFCITDEELVRTNETLASASAARGIEFVALNAADGQPHKHRVPRAGDLLYRAATGVRADRLEKLVWLTGVSAFYDDPFFECHAQSIWMQRAGIAMPKTIHVVPTDRATIAACVDSLGGFPVVLKVPGGEGGQGVMRADSLPSLFSLLDYLPSNVQLMAYFEHVVAYHAVVLGPSVIATEARHPGAFDFRSNAHGGNLGAVRTPPKIAKLALAAARALKLEFGGADILEDARGRVVLAELNFPCYFADQQSASGVDIAGQMVDNLVAKSRRINRRRK